MKRNNTKTKNGHKYGLCGLPISSNARAKFGVGIRSYIYFGCKFCVFEFRIYRIRYVYLLKFIAIPSKFHSSWKRFRQTKSLKKKIIIESHICSVCGLVTSGMFYVCKHSNIALMLKF